MKRLSTRLTIVGLLAFALQACAHYRSIALDPVTDASIGGSRGAATEYEEELVYSYAWGLVQQRPQIDNCNGQGLYEVVVSSGIRQALLRALTIGGAAPATIRWKCDKPTPTVGRLEQGADEVERLEKGGDDGGS